MRAMSCARRRSGVGLSLSLAVLLVMAVVPPAHAATVGGTWRAEIGTAGANGTATIRAYTTGSGSLALKLTGLKAATELPVTISTGACASAGSTLISFPAITTTSAGTASRTLSLTGDQVTTLRSATQGTGKVAIRIGDGTAGGTKCGVFAVIYVPIGIVLPLGRVQDRTRLLDALGTSGYGARVLFSRDSASEKASVRKLIGEGIKVLILSPQDSAGAASAADMARAAGVKVIAYDRLIRDTSAVDYYVTFNNVAVGAAQARYLIDRAGTSRGNNLYLYGGAISDDNSFQFLQGAWKKLQPKIADGTFVIRNSSVAVALRGKPTLTRDQTGRILSQVTTDWNPGNATYLAESNLMAVKAAAKGTVFILGPNDTTARAIADAFAADKDVTRSYVTGQDAEKASVQYIIDGRQGMTVFKDPRSLARAAIDGAVAFLEGDRPAATTTSYNGRIRVPATYLPVVTVTGDNVQAALIDTGYYQATDFTGSWPGKP